VHWLVAPLIIAGVIRCAKKARTVPALVTLLGALVAPLAGASFGQARYMANALALLPFLTLLAAYGVDWAMDLVWPRSRPRLDTESADNFNEISV
jgi:hypothetical protein